MNKNIIDGVIGVSGIVLTSITENISLWVSIVCSVAIALTTCFVQCYRLWRDRDNDKKDKGDKNE